MLLFQESGRWECFDPWQTLKKIFAECWANCPGRQTSCLLWQILVDQQADGSLGELWNQPTVDDLQRRMDRWPTAQLGTFQD